MSCDTLFLCNNGSQQPVKPIGTEYEQDVQYRYDNDIQRLCDAVAQDTLHALAQVFQRRDVAGVEIVEIRLQQLRHSGGNNAEADGKHNNSLCFFRLGCVQIQRKNQNKTKDDKIVEHHRVETEVAAEEIRNIPCAVDQTGVDQRQERGGHTDSGGDGGYGSSVLSFIECHYRHHENEQRAKMEGQMVKVISFHQRCRLFSNFQRKKKAGDDLKGDHADLDILFANGDAQNHSKDDHQGYSRRQGFDVLGRPKFHGMHLAYTI